MGAEDATVRVRFVQHHVPQLGEESGPVRVVGEQRGVEHVGVGEHQPTLLADGAPLTPGSVAIVHARLDRSGQLRQRLQQPQDSLELVLGQRLGREQVQGRGLRLLKQSFQHRQVVAEALAAGRAGGDYGVLPAAQKLNGPDLVRVKSADPSGGKCPLQSRRERRVQLPAARRPRRQLFHVDQLPFVAGQTLQMVQKSLHVHEQSSANRSSKRP